MWLNHGMTEPVFAEQLVHGCHVDDSAQAEEEKSGKRAATFNDREKPEIIYPGFRTLLRNGATIPE